METQILVLVLVLDLVLVLVVFVTSDGGLVELGLRNIIGMQRLKVSRPFAE